MNRRPARHRRTVAVLAACGDDDDSSDAAACGGDDRRRAGVRHPRDVRVVARRWLTEVLADFTAETGIDVEVVNAGDTGTMVPKAVLTAGNPEGDVMFGVDNTFLSEVVGVAAIDGLGAYLSLKLIAECSDDLFLVAQCQAFHLLAGAGAEQQGSRRQDALVTNAPVRGPGCRPFAPCCRRRRTHGHSVPAVRQKLHLSPCSDSRGRLCGCVLNF